MSETKKPKLTSDEYVARHGVVCPFCKSKNIESQSGDNSYDADMKSITVECLRCGKAWQDIYTLTGYEVDE